MSSTKLYPVQSSNITHLGYDHETGTLHVMFRGSGEYLYRGVTPEEAADLAQAQSVGSHFHKHIKGKYQGVKRI